jgi:ATPase subunit of ABC transporter with duplicated ATPase domains
MITLKDISKAFGSRILFEGVSITFNEGLRYALTGPNGAGKSTLLKVIMGLEEATTGEVSLPEKVGILRQNIEDYAEFTALDTVIMGNPKLWAAKQERDSLYEGEITDAIGIRLGELEEVVA